jgi:hypothetical protein
MANEIYIDFEGLTCEGKFGVYAGGSFCPLARSYFSDIRLVFSFCFAGEQTRILGTDRPILKQNYALTI